MGRLLEKREERRAEVTNKRRDLGEDALTLVTHRLIFTPSSSDPATNARRL
jgi:hypothetical protein